MNELTNGSQTTQPESWSHTDVLCLPRAGVAENVQGDSHQSASLYHPQLSHTAVRKQLHSLWGCVEVCRMYMYVCGRERGSGRKVGGKHRRGEWVCGGRSEMEGKRGKEEWKGTRGRMKVVQRIKAMEARVCGRDYKRPQTLHKFRKWSLMRHSKSQLLHRVTSPQTQTLLWIN